jgi:hypothetical protein
MLVRAKEYTKEYPNGRYTYIEVEDDIEEGEENEDVLLE